MEPLGAGVLLEELSHLGADPEVFPSDLCFLWQKPSSPKLLLDGYLVTASEKVTQQALVPRTCAVARTI